MRDSTPGSDGDPHATALISRLANEIFSGAPATEATLPWGPPVTAGRPGIPQADPTAAFSSAPPVHPVVEPGAPAANTTTPPAPTPEKAEETYEYGEPVCPDFQLQEGRAREAQASQPPEAAQSPDSAGAWPDAPFAVPGLDGAGLPDFYFLPRSEPAAHHAAAASPANEPGPLDVASARNDFPALHQRVNGRPLVWLDNAATTHKPQSVIDATSRFYSRDNSNIHRAAHTLAARSTDLFEAGRENVRRFLGAADTREIVFVRGSTEAINLVAQSYGRKNIGAGDEIILTELEHHANIVPWQLLAAQTGASIRVIPINERGELILSEFVKLLGPRTKFVSVAHVSNALGTVNPVGEIIAIAHARGVPVLVDGAQSTPHLPVNVQALGADFYVFSGHKIFAPTGIGALYGKLEHLEAMPPWQGGGHMIRDVRFERTIHQNAPEKFEAGTPDIAGVVGLGAAIDYLFQLGIPAIAAYEHGLLEYATQALAAVPGLRPVGTAADKASVLSFVIPGRSNEKIARHLDHHGIAVRAGHHCAMPALRHFGLESTVRPSLAFYNNREDVDALVSALLKLPRE